MEKNLFIGVLIGIFLIFSVHLSDSIEITGTVISNVTVIGVNATEEGGGGGPIPEPPEFELDTKLCGFTLDYLNKSEHGYFVTLNETLFMINYTYNISYSENDFTYYLINWQQLCSDIMKKSLKEDIVCLYVGSFLEYNDLRGIDDLDYIKSNLAGEINISSDLIRYYAENYNEMCKPGKKKNYIFLIILSVIIFLLLVILTLTRKMRKMIKSFFR